mmetsp:Transcript_102735/g.260991  ORF Transcript_102735/g.260991 Transcript_102735/m.260991 type:complete len:207 (-) Transcript_102735:428-1048(-)
MHWRRAALPWAVSSARPAAGVSPPIVALEALGHPSLPRSSGPSAAAPAAPAAAAAPASDVAAPPAPATAAACTASRAGSPRRAAARAAASSCRQRRARAPAWAPRSGPATGRATPSATSNPRSPRRSAVVPWEAPSTPKRAVCGRPCEAPARSPLLSVPEGGPAAAGSRPRRCAAEPSPARRGTYATRQRQRAPTADNRRSTGRSS